MVNLEYIELAARTMAQRAKEAAANGNAESAREFAQMSIKKYEQAIELCPARAAEFRGKIAQIKDVCENIAVRQKATDGGAAAKPVEPKNKKESEPDKPDDKDLDDELTRGQALENLDKMVGLADVKNEVQDLVAMLELNQMRKKEGLPAIEGVSHHLIFTGNPGTGKTTVARLMAQIYKSLGILSKGQLVEVGRDDLVAGYVGQTAIKTSDVLNKAKGGVLFIDEVYTLSAGGEHDFGREAINTILRFMENNRDDFAVIVAGYGGALMDNFIATNPGLMSRFRGKPINFSDYDGDELFLIFDGLCEKYMDVYDDAFEAQIKRYFNSLYENRRADFGNGRTVRNTYENLTRIRARRLKGTNPTREQMQTFILDDVLSL